MAKFIVCLRSASTSMQDSTYTRRKFISIILSSLGGLSLLERSAFAQPAQTVFKGETMFKRIMSKSAKWSSFPIGELVGKIAMTLEGVPYQAHTLELSIDREICSVNLEGLDCVTFFETTLALARMLKKGGKNADALLSEVRCTRYRGGVLGDFSSRLHYTSDWLLDNQDKGTIKLLTDLPGKETFVPHVDFMSKHFLSYPQLKAHPELVAKIKSQEDRLNSRTLEYVPVKKLAGAEPFLKTGDIIGLCTNEPGLDITHTGLIMCDKGGIPHFMHASSSKSNYKVTLQTVPIKDAWVSSKSITGATFARPLEP